MSLAHDRASSRGQLLAVILSGLLVYALLQAVFFPMSYSPADEGCYVSMAFMFAHGRLSAEGLPLNLYRFDRVDGRLVGGHDAGTSLLMTPLTIFGERALFAFNMMLHAAGFVVFALLLRRLRIHPVFALLYLLHPTLWYYSRNLINDPTSAVFVLAGVWTFLLGGAGVFAAGVLWGLSLFVRPSTAFFLAPAAAAWLILAIVRRNRPDAPPEYRRPLRRTLLLIAGSLPLLVPLLIYNVAVMQSWSGLAASRRLEMLPSMFLPNLWHYVLRLNLLYPLMLIAFILYHGPLRVPMFAAAVGGGLFYLLYPETGLIGGYGFAESVVLGLRRLAPVLAFMLLAYAFWMQRLLRRFGRPFMACFLVSMVVVLGSDVYINIRHQAQQKRAAALRDAMFDATSRGSLIILNYPARRYISAEVLRPRTLVTPFLHPKDSGITTEDLDRMISSHDNAYVAILHPGGSVEAHPDARAAMDAFLQRRPHKTVVDTTRDGWHLIVYRLE